MSFQDVIRRGSEHGLLRAGRLAWRRYRDMRARTSHTWLASAAAEVVACIPKFLVEATYSLD
jgi:nucleotidyltransferase-like protein